MKKAVNFPTLNDGLAHRNKSRRQIFTIRKVMINTIKDEVVLFSPGL